MTDVVVKIHTNFSLSIVSNFFLYYTYMNCNYKVIKPHKQPIDLSYICCNIPSNNYAVRSMGSGLLMLKS